MHDLAKRSSHHQLGMPARTVALHWRTIWPLPPTCKTATLDEFCDAVQAGNPKPPRSDAMEDTAGQIEKASTRYTAED